MKRFALFLSVIFWLVIALTPATGVAQSSAGPDVYKAALDRLQSLTRQDETEWRSHTDVPHPEDTELRDSDWNHLTIKNLAGPGGQTTDAEQWKGTKVFRRWIEIPEKIKGYSTQGAKVRLDLRFSGPDSAIITVFSNEAILYRGDEDDLLPVLLTANAQAGQKFLVAVRVVADDEAE